MSLMLSNKMSIMSIDMHNMSSTFIYMYNISNMSWKLQAKKVWFWWPFKKYQNLAKLLHFLLYFQWLPFIFILWRLFSGDFVKTVENKRFEFSVDNLTIHDLKCLGISKKAKFAQSANTHSPVPVYWAVG